MKQILRLFFTLLLLLLSGCLDFTHDKATRNTLNVINMKVGTQATMTVFYKEPYSGYNSYYNNLFLDEWSDVYIYDPTPYTIFPYEHDPFYDDDYLYYYATTYGNKKIAKRLFDGESHYSTIKYTYHYNEAKQYYLNFSNDSFILIEGDANDNIKVPASNLRNREQSLVIFGSSGHDMRVRIPLDVRVFTNVKAAEQGRVSINFINALPTETGSNILPVLNYASTVHLEVNGVRVSAPLDYRENDRFEIDGVRDTQESIELTLVLANGAAPTWNKKLQKGHTYNVVVGHAENSLSAEPTLYVYDVTPAKDNT